MAIRRNIEVGPNVGCNVNKLERRLEPLAGQLLE